MSKNSNDVSVPTVGEQEESEVYHAYHDTASDRDLSETVIDAIADVADIDPTETRIPLSDSVDPDALDAIFAEKIDGTTREDAHLSFSVCGLRTVVYSNGHILISNET